MAEPGALGLDFLTQIVNVHWGSPSLFAVGGTVRDATQEGPIGVFFLKKKTDTEPWGHTHMDPGSPAPPPPTDHQPVSFGGTGPRGTGMWYNHVLAMVGGKITATEPGGEDEKILVAGGYRSVMIGLTNLHITEDGLEGWVYLYQATALLFWSDDGGKTWTEVPCPVTAPPGQEGVVVDVQVSYLAFDPAAKTFYGDVLKVGSEGATSEPYVERTTITSSDGKSWAKGVSDRRNLVGASDWTSPFLANIKGIKNNGLTEIIDTSTDPEVKLTYTQVEVEENSFGGRLKLTPPWKMEPPPEEPEDWELKPGHVRIDDIPVGEEPRAGIAYSSGRFLIAGSLMTDGTPEGDWGVQAYVSNNDGLSWKQTLDDKTTYMIADNVNNPEGCAGSCGCAGA